MSFKDGLGCTFLCLLPAPFFSPPLLPLPPRPAIHKVLANYGKKHNNLNDAMGSFLFILT